MRFIWTKRAIEWWVNDKPDPMHTISAPNIADVYEGYVAQLKKETPWILVDENDLIVESGAAGIGTFNQIMADIESLA